MAFRSFRDVLVIALAMTWSAGVFADEAVDEHEPVVDAVAPSPGEPGVFTLTGRHLMDQETSAWAIGEADGSFENGTPGAFVGSQTKKDGWSPYGGGNSPVRYDDKEALIGKQSMHGNPRGSGKLGAVTYRGWRYVEKDMYFRYYFKYAEGYPWPDNFNKQCIVSNVYVQPLMHPPVRRYLAGFCGDNRHYVDLPKELYGGTLPDGRWYCMEIRLRAATGNENEWNGEVEAWIDGVRISDFKNMAPQTNPPATQVQAFQIGMINGADFHDADGHFWIDGVGISTKRINPAALVEVGDKPDYEAAKKVRQPLLHVADDAIRFKADLKGLGPGPYYVWVTNNRTKRSDAFVMPATP